MLDRNNLPQDMVDQVKRHLSITWTDDDTDSKIIDMMLDAEIAMNHKLGAEVDYFSPGPERRLYLNYMLYCWSDCLNEFDSAYRAEILQIRHKYEVRGAAADDTQEE